MEKKYEQYHVVYDRKRTRTDLIRLRPGTKIMTRAEALAQCAKLRVWIDKVRPV